MTNLLELKEHIKGLYGRFEIYITPVIKFILMFVTLSMINGRLGYFARLDSTTMVLLVSLVSAILPYNFMLLASAAFIVLHLYKFSLESAVVMLVLFVLMFLLYFRFAAGDGIIVMLTPLCCMLRIPLIMPVSAGLISSPASAVSVCCGVTIYNLLNHITENKAAIESLDAESMVQKYRLIVDGIINNKSMLVMAAAFGITVVLVYIIRRLPVDHSWMIAIVAGVILPLAIMLMGDLSVDTGFEIGPWILGAILSFGILIVVQFFVFSVDYQRTERVQFEDDEYYYYVKAVPKMNVARADKTVKKITPHSSPSYNRYESKSDKPRKRTEDFDEDFLDFSSRKYESPKADVKREVRREASAKVRPRQPSQSYTRGTGAPPRNMR